MNKDFVKEIIFLLFIIDKLIKQKLQVLSRGQFQNSIYLWKELAIIMNVNIIRHKKINMHFTKKNILVLDTRFWLIVHGSFPLACIQFFFFSILKQHFLYIFL